MYSHCIFCSAALGSNEVLEDFPVGRAVAFDAERGRLWAVCPACARWNLAPIEERWEPVEAAEAQFRDARLRVQSENVGLAKMPDGTSLIRVGAAVPGEMAAWRYGRQLMRRRVRSFVIGAAGMGALGVAWSGLNAIGVLGGGYMLWVGMTTTAEALGQQQTIHRLEGGKVIRRGHIPGISLAAGPDGDVELHVRQLGSRVLWPNGVSKSTEDITVVRGEAARAALARSMVVVNASGATKSRLTSATGLLEELGSPEELLRRSAAMGVALGDRGGRKPVRFKGADALAFEMALNEESERVAMEGELSALAAAWREAEEIAAIADALPFGGATARSVGQLRRMLR